MHRAERFCWVRIDGVRSTVTLFHLAGFNLLKQHELSYVEVGGRERHNPDLSSTSDWLKCIGNLIPPIRSNIQR